MIAIFRFILWATLQYGCLVAGDDVTTGISRVFLNTTSKAPSTISSTSRTAPAFAPSHGPTRPTLMSTATLLGGHTVSDGSFVASMGDTVTGIISFSRSPVAVSVGIPTGTDSSLPWTGRVLTDPGIQTSNGIASSLVSGSFLVSMAQPTATSDISNSSSSKWFNTTASSATSVAASTNKSSPTSSINLATPGNLSTFTVSSATISRGNLSRTSLSLGTPTYILFKNVSTCSTLSAGQPVTIWSILPNTTTTTLTITGNLSTSLMPQPEFTPPVYCPTSGSTSAEYNHRTSPFSISSTVPLFIAPPRPTSALITLTKSAGISSTVYIPGLSSAAEPSTIAPNRITVTSITTSKNGITEITSATLPSYGDPKTDRLTVDPSSIPPDSYQHVPQTQPARPNEPIPTPITTIYAGDPAATTPITEIVSGVTVVASPSKAVIGSQTVSIGSAPQTLTESGQVFTILPNEIDGPSVIISIPTYTAGGVFVQTLTPTTINGLSIGLGGSTVVIGGTSYNIGPGAPQQTVVAKGQTITLGSSGIAFDSTTITAAPNPASTPTNIAIVGGSVITAVGSSVAVIGGQTITYGANTPQTTTVFNGESITLGPSGVIFHGSTIGGTALSPSSSQIGIVGGVSITEVGSSIAVIAGTTFTIGPGANPTTAIISSQTVSAGPDGLSDGSFLWNPFPSATHTLTAGSITFSQIGSSLVVIGSQTFTVGPGASPTTDVYAGQTISIGPSGIGFATTTFTSFGTSTGTGTGTGTAANAKSTSKKNAATGLRPGFGVLAIGILVGIGGWLL
ncbi:hypothetical protein EG329_007048 [Mollisiaceae sp. DMI_Dod_QoI]|nr:hypothetical protein EG329_007048 [Helotiales sp. DMI_Dod_QoI]